ncbi:hypothetical protein ACFFGH_27375 [Lysobacter korlensis]|uniref:Xylose isomerase-like TIM barrel domain-containing protein n=1 Tax=Lysobacter korlensis TaxID=553636 RepID=A0ABV6RYL2_9GAMM
MTADRTLADPNWAVTLFSFTTELVAGADPNGIVETIATEGGIRRIEIDGFQHFPGLPRVGDAEAAEFRELADRLDLELTELGIYADLALHPDRLLTMDETVQYLADQVASAAKLGFPAVKVMFGIDTAMQEGLLPHLERHGIPLYQEVQGPVRIDSPELDRQREFAAQHGGGLLGFVFDSSACMPAVPATYVEELRANSVPESAIRLLEEDWAGDRSGQVRGEFTRLTAEAGLPPSLHPLLAMPFMRFGSSTVAEFRDFLPEVSIVHLKFWDLEDADGRVSRPIADLRRELGAIGFDGAITSEWGGHEYLDPGAYRPLDMTLQHRELYDRALPPHGAGA